MTATITDPRSNNSVSTDNQFVFRIPCADADITFHDHAVIGSRYRSVRQCCSDSDIAQYGKS